MPAPPSTIRKRADFLAANRGLRVARPGFVLLAHPNGGRGKRFGITVTKKVGNAVVRNRMKRRFRELLRAALPERGLADHDHVLIGRDGGIERDFTALSAELDEALARAAAGKAATPRRAANTLCKRSANTVQSGVDGWRRSVYCAATRGAATATIRFPDRLARPGAFVFSD